MNYKIIKDINDVDLKFIAKMHKRYLSMGFLSKLNTNFLALLYKTMIQDPHSFVIAAKHNQNVIGFVSGTCNINSLYKNFLKKHFILGFIYLFPYLFSFDKLIKIIELILYPFKKNKKTNLPSAELLSIIVNKDFRGAGVSSLLYKELVQEFNKRHVDKFKIIVGDKLVAAQKFYEKNGAPKFGGINVHNSKKSFVYIANIK
jgi:ribosomal protein S18 acetylase RimI-like enzyme